MPMVVGCVVVVEVKCGPCYEWFLGNPLKLCIFFGILQGLTVNLETISQIWQRKSPNNVLTIELSYVYYSLLMISYGFVFVMEKVVKMWI